MTAIVLLTEQAVSPYLVDSIRQKLKVIMCFTGMTPFTSLIFMTCLFTRISPSSIVGGNLLGSGP